MAHKQLRELHSSLFLTVLVVSPVSSVPHGSGGPDPRERGGVHHPRQLCI